MLYKMTLACLTHVASGSDAVSTSTDHLVCGQDAPPVGLPADVVANDWQESLLQDVSQRTFGCGGGNSGKKQDSSLLLLFQKKVLYLFTTLLPYNNCNYF